LNAQYQIGFWYDNPFFGPHPSPEQDAHREAYDVDKMSIRMDHNRYCWQEGQHLALFGVPWRAKHKKYDDLTGWQKDRGQDLHSVVVDPESIRSDRGPAIQPSDRGAISDYRPNNKKRR
jgi:hypothetical protein